MRALVVISRILLGAVVLIHGLNVFFHFIPIPPPPPGGTAALFVTGLSQSGYFFPFLAIVEIACGALLVTGRYVPLALTMLAPLTLQILAFHTFLLPNGLLLALFLVSLNVFLAVAYRDCFREVLRSRAEPSQRDGVSLMWRSPEEKRRLSNEIQKPAEA